jgi:hypothetical protein
MTLMKCFLVFCFAIFIQHTLSAQLPDLIPYRASNGLWGYCDSTKKIIIPCKFSEAKLFETPDSTRGELEYKPGWIMKNGDFHPDTAKYFEYPDWRNYYSPWQLYNTYTIAYPLYYKPPPCTGLSLCIDSVSRQLGFKNCEGKIVIPCIYPEAYSFSEGLAIVKLNDSIWQYINEQGKTILEFKNRKLGNFKNGHAVVMAEMGLGSQGVIDKKGNFIVPPICINIVIIANKFLISTQVQDYHEASYNSDYYSEDPNMNSVISTTYYACILLDTNGKWSDNQVYSTIQECSNSWYLAQAEGGYGFFDPSLKQITPFKYYDARIFDSFNVAAVCDTNERWGFVNTKGKEIIPLKYKNVRSFNNGLVGVQGDDELWEFYSAKGKKTTPRKYKEARFYQNGFIAVSDTSDKWGFVNEKGKEVIPCSYDYVSDFSMGLVAVGKAVDEDGYSFSMMGFINEKGKIIIPLKYPMSYDAPVFGDNGLFLLENGYIDIHGAEYWDAE